MNDNQNLSKEKLLTEIERLKKELKKRKKYGLVWEDKPEEVVEMCKEKLPVLKEVKSKEIITDKEKPVNLLIEGDNYHALSVLNYTHAKKVDVIYIDPPYNTGNKDFIFNDCYVDREDAYRHSKWLSFMEKRLKLAKNLLKDTGVIFISIDDNEMAQLKLLMDSPDLFGEQNFIIDVIWNSRKSVSSDTIVSLNHNHTLIYARNLNVLREIVKNELKFKLQARLEKFANPDNDPGGPWIADPFDAPNIRPNLTYPIKNPNTGKVYYPPNGRCWRTTKEEYKRFLKEGRIIFGKNGKSKPQLKRYLSVAEEKGVTPKSIWDDVGTTTNGTQELENILGEKKFNNPKPVSLIRKIIELTTDKNSIVLDFMAGSGTTGHAVLELNKEEGGNRKFILCTNNEDNNGNGYKIAEDICYPRIKKVIEGYKNLKGEKVDGLGSNLKYFKTDFVDAEPTDRNKIKLTEQATEMLCVKEGTFESVLDQKTFKIFENTNHYTGIIFDQTAIPAFKKAIKDIKGKFSVYVFSFGDEFFDDEFSDVKQKVQLSPIPEAILRVYRRIFK